MSNKRESRDYKVTEHKRKKAKSDYQNQSSQTPKIREENEGKESANTNNRNINNTAEIETSQSSLTPSNNPLSSSSINPIPGAPEATTKTKAKIIVVLVKSSLETVKTKKGYELVSADSHKGVLTKLKKNPSDYRPDITHQCLLTLLDSPLNKSGLLQIYLQTEKNVLIEVNPSIRIPRTFKRFAGLMVQLLHKMKIRSNESNDLLLKVIKNPVTNYFPPGALRLGTSVQGTLVDMRDLAKKLGGEKAEELKFPIIFCVGAHSTGPAEVDWTEQVIAVSKYPLSASVALGRIMNAFEYQWGIL